jgi:hypothetical protein
LTCTIIEFSLGSATNVRALPLATKPILRNLADAIHIVTPALPSSVFIAALAGPFIPSIMDTVLGFLDSTAPEFPSAPHLRSGASSVLIIAVPRLSRWLHTAVGTVACLSITVEFTKDAVQFQDTTIVNTHSMKAISIQECAMCVGTAVVWVTVRRLCNASHVVANTDVARTVERRAIFSTSTISILR